MEKKKKRPFPCPSHTRMPSIPPCPRSESQLRYVLGSWSTSSKKVSAPTGVAVGQADLPDLFQIQNVDVSLLPPKIHPLFPRLLGVWRTAYYPISQPRCQVWPRGCVLPNVSRGVCSTSGGPRKPPRCSFLRFLHPVTRNYNDSGLRSHLLNIGLGP